MYRCGMKELGALIRERRERRGLRALDLAAEIERPPNFVSRIETGAMKEMPNPRDMAAIGRALDLPQRDMLQALGYLADETEAAPNRDDVTEAQRRLRPLLEQITWDDETILMVARYLTFVAEISQLRKASKERDESSGQAASAL
ncbi:MAG: Helix-turn-helix domain [Thermomicrobiales bacterium]|nr:Helix-turn-helix domain [Thermomicrobiales bacterium]